MTTKHIVQGARESADHTKFYQPASTAQNPKHQTCREVQYLNKSYQ